MAIKELIVKAPAPDPFEVRPGEMRWMSKHKYPGYWRYLQMYDGSLVMVRQQNGIGAELKCRHDYFGAAVGYAVPAIDHRFENTAWKILWINEPVKNQILRAVVTRVGVDEAVEFCSSAPLYEIRNDY